MARERRDPRKFQGALEKTPESMEWQLRIERALKGGESFSEREIAHPPAGYGGGATLPAPGEFKYLERQLEKRMREGGPVPWDFEPPRGRYYVPPDLNQFDPRTGRPLTQDPRTGRPLAHPASLAPGSIDATRNDPQFEATGALNVNVRGPRGTSVKADGTGPFETVNMTRRMTEESQLGTS